jgi:hypothetical protein
MSHRPARAEQDIKTTWKSKKLIQRHKETLKEVQQLIKEKDMQRSESQDSKNKQ